MSPQNSKNADIDGLKMEVAKLTTEKETLEMTLDLRDRELKAKKEEFRGELSSLEQRKSELEQEADAKSSRMAATEAELTVLKDKLAETARDLASAKSQVADLTDNVSRVEEAAKDKDESLMALRSELEQGGNSIGFFGKHNLSLNRTKNSPKCHFIRIHGKNTLISQRNLCKCS